jgi:hypothetical protein
VLAPSVNFQIELIAFAFVQSREARTLNRADVHKCIGLAIIADQEAKALHRVEELDRACDTLTCQLTLRCSGLGRHGDDITHNLQILRRHLAAAIHEIVLKLLPFGETFQTGTFDSADVNEHIFTATILLDETEAFLGVEELHRALAGANDLGWHARSAAEAAATTARATGTARATAAARAARGTAAEAITAPTAKTIAATAETVTTTAEFARWRKAIIPAAKRIKTFFAKTVALVAAAPASPIVTHKSVRTLPHCPSSNVPTAGTASRAGHRRAELANRCAHHPFIAHKELLCEQFYRQRKGQRAAITRTHAATLVRSRRLGHDTQH